MSLVVPPVLGRRGQSNLTAANRVGTSIASAGFPSNTKGSWVEVIASTDAPTYGIDVNVYGVRAFGTTWSIGFLMDIGIGPAGSEMVLIPDLDLWGAPSVGYGRGWFFPVYIPTGSRLVARAQAQIGGERGNLFVTLYQHNPYPMIVSRWQAYGADYSISAGTSVTPGNGVFGPWTNIGSPTLRPHYWWQVGYDSLTDATFVTTRVLVEVGYLQNGANVSIGSWLFMQDGAAYVMNGPAPSVPIYHPVPAGTQLRARIASAETEPRGVIIYAGD